MLGRPGGVDVAVDRQPVVGGILRLGPAERVRVVVVAQPAQPDLGQMGARRRGRRAWGSRDASSSRSTRSRRRRAPARRARCIAARTRWRTPERDPAAGLGRQRPQHARDLAGGAAGAGGLDREHVLEVGDQLGVVGIAVLDALGGRGVDDRGERRGHLGTLGLHVRELLADVLHRHRHLVLALERNLAGQHLVEDDAERVEVRLAGHRPAEGLLGET